MPDLHCYAAQECHGRHAKAGRKWRRDTASSSYLPLQNALANIAQWLKMGPYFPGPFRVRSLGPGFRTTHLRVIKLIQRQVLRTITRQLAIAPCTMHAGDGGELRQMIDVVPLVKIVLDIWGTVQTHR